MKMNKNQSLYRALPSAWITYTPKNSNYNYAARVTRWNTSPVENINEDLIKRDISRRVKSFAAAQGGEVDSSLREENIHNLKFVEPCMNEGFADINCVMDPCTFYCQECGSVRYIPKMDKSPICYKCKEEKNKEIKMNQLQMVYACECGFATGVKPKWRGELIYNYKDNTKRYKFYNPKTKKYDQEMEMTCDVCGKRLYPKNAIDPRLFYSQSGNIVNLYNEKYASVIKEYGCDGEFLSVAKWLNVIDNEKFSSILENSKTYFEGNIKSENDPDVINIAKSLGIPAAQVAAAMNLSSSSDNIETLKNKVFEKISPNVLNDGNMMLISKDLMEFDTLKYPRSVIDLETAIDSAKNSQTLADENVIYDLLEKIGIESIQVSEGVEIVNYAYGYTRLKSCPSSECPNLRLKGFDNNVFTSILETEGILVELDMLKIFKWLEDNCPDLPELDYTVNTKEEAKKWFIEHINLDTITAYSTIEGGYNLVTKMVYSLIHTISHLMIISAGKHSGLGRDSISEIIFPNACSFFIYPTSSEGITLGSISGMFETELAAFLQDTLTDNEVCTFDPICTNTQNGACLACTYLSEVNCAHFNKDLSRIYLYGNNKTIRINDDKIQIKKGFWK